MNERTFEDDAALVARAQTGNREAFARLVDRHLGPTYAIALAIQGNENEAEELVQDAVVQAWQGLRGLRDPGRFAAWLAQIVRHRAARGRRTQARARAAALAWSEQAAAAPTEEEKMRRREATAELQAKIQALPEHLRVPLVLYYFEDVSSSSAAERLGLEPATFRKRVQLARDQLRTELESDLERAASGIAPRPEFRRSLQVLILGLPLPGVTTASTTATTMGTTLKAGLGGLLMKKAAGIAVGLVIVLAGILHWWPPGSPPTETARNSSSEVESRTPGSVEHGSTGASNSIAPPLGGAKALGRSSTSTEENRTPLLIGMVLDENDNPVTDAVVHMFPSDRELPALDDPTYRLDVSSTGDFSSGPLEPNTYTLAVRAPGFRYRAIEDLRLQLTSQRDVVIQLEQGLEISGVVLDPMGGPAAGATVRVVPAAEESSIEGSDGKRASITIARGSQGTLEHLVATTDSSGSFQLVGMRPDTYEVSATHDAWPFTRRTPIVAGTTDLILQFEKGAELYGRVFDPRGQPVPNALIRVPHPPSGRDRRRTTSDDEGRFRLTGLDEGPVQIRIEANGYPHLVPPFTRLVAGESAGEQRYDLKPGAAITGVVQTARFTPLDGASLRLMIKTQTKPLAITHSAADGSFRFDALSAATPDATLKIHGEAHLGWEQELTLVPAEVIDLGTIALDAGSSIEGSVVDSDGNPLSGIAIRSDSREHDSGRTRRVSGLETEPPSTHTDAVGAFRLGPFPPGAASLRAQGEGYATVRQTVSVEDGDVLGVVLRLGEGYKFQAQLMNDLGTLLSGVTVKARSETLSWAVSDSNGTISISGLPATYTIEVEAEGHLPFSAEFTESNTINLELSRTARLYGKVRSRATGRPVPEFTVTVVEPDGAETHELPLVDIEGHYEVDGISPGKCAVRVDAAGFAPFFLSDVLVVPGQDKLVDVRLAAGRILSGRVVSSSGEPLAGVRLELVAPSEFEVKKEPQLAIMTMGPGQVHAIRIDRGPADAETDEEGRFEFADAPDGLVHVRFSKAQYLPRVLSVTEGSVVTLRKGGGVRGKVRLPDGSPCIGGLLTVRALDAEDFDAPVPISISKEGNYAISGLPDGSYELSPLALMTAENAGDDGFLMTPDRHLPITIHVREQRIDPLDLDLEVRNEP